MQIYTQAGLDHWRRPWSIPWVYWCMLYSFTVGTKG